MEVSTTMRFWFPAIMRCKSFERPANGRYWIKVGADLSLLKRYKAGFPAPLVRPTTQKVVGSVEPFGINLEAVASARMKPFSGRLRYVCVCKPGVLRRLPPDLACSPTVV